MVIRSVALMLGVLSVQAQAETGTDYRLGRGYALGSTGIRLGGYASAAVDAPRHGPWQFDVSDLSLFVTWEDGEHWRFFSETEVGDALTAGEHQGLGTGEAHFELERLYVERLFTDALSLRFGKFLTPIGRWNLVHANPLVWTTNRPVATRQLFSKHASGLMLHGKALVAERDFDYAVYATADSLDPYRSENPFENAYGGHLLYAATETLELGLSYANFALNERPSRYHLAGAEAFWSYCKFEASAEWVFRSGGARDLWQGYVQGVAPLLAGWYAVARYEYFQQESAPDGQVGVLGLAFRPVPPLVWKVEYQVGSHNATTAPDGLYGSFAVLF